MKNATGDGNGHVRLAISRTVQGNRKHPDNQMYG